MSDLQRLRFVKMQGIGNDFVVIDDLDSATPVLMTPERARRICDRRYGVGADQIVWLKKPAGAAPADARMEIWNADGTTAEMCGNGIRALALHLFRREGRTRGQRRFDVETLAGLKTVEVRPGDATVRVNMGPPRLEGGFPGGKAPPRAEGEWLADAGVRFLEVNVGNPHAVIFVDDVASAPVERLGPVIERHPRFPKRTNVEFVQVLQRNSIRVRVWERGAGVTLACGTGACASAVATLASGRATGALEVQLDGGNLKIEWAGEGQPVWMEGPAEECFRGELVLPPA